MGAKKYRKKVPFVLVLSCKQNHLQRKLSNLFYCNRGTMENFIKEGKNGFEFDRMSSTSFVVNRNKLQISMLAYNFNNWFRRLCMAKDVQSFQMETIRKKVIKVAVKVARHARKVTFKLCSSHPYKHLFEEIMQNLCALPLLE